MANKLIQIQAAEPNAGWTAASLKAAFEKAGFAGDTGAQAHFLKYGHSEDVSPNSLFDANYYYQAKAIAYYTSSEAGSEQVTKAEVLADLAGYGSKMEAIIKGVGMDAWTHYIKYGTKEGINPSNNFDTSDYMEAKIEAMNGSMTADEVYAAFKKAGFNALMHEQIYAGKGGTNEVDSTSFPVPADEQFEPVEDETGATFTLTTGTDYADGKTAYTMGGAVQSDFRFTTGDETVKAGVNTLNGTDTLSDVSTSDNDTLEATFSNAIVTPALTNIETINLALNSAGGRLNLTNVSGTKQINVTTNFAAGDDNYGVIGQIDATTTSPVVNFTASGNRGLVLAAQTLEGTSDTINASVSGATEDKGDAPSLTIADLGATAGKLETLNITSDGETANVVNVVLDDGTISNALNGGGVAVDGIKKIVVDGSQDLELRADGAALTEVAVDGSGLEGDLTVRVDMDGGAAGAHNVNVTNFTDVDNLIVWDSDSNTTNAFNVYNTTSGSTVRVGSDFTNAASSITMKNDSSADSLTVELDTVATKATDVTVLGLTIAGVETVNVVSNGAKKANEITTLTSVNATTITVSGDSDLSMNLANITHQNAIALDASAYEGNATINMTQQADATTAGRAVTITAGSGDDALYGGAITMKTTFNLSKGGANTVGVQAGDINDIVTGFDDDDVLSIVAASADAATAVTAATVKGTAFVNGLNRDNITSTDQDTIEAAASVDAAAAAAATAANTTMTAAPASWANTALLFTYKGSYYVFMNGADDQTFDAAKDAVVQLSGTFDSDTDFNADAFMFSA